MRKKRRTMWIGLALAALIAIWWNRREPAWSVSLTADRESPLTPWQPVNLVAQIEPQSALQSRLFKFGEWHWQWEADSIPFSVRGPDVGWRSGKIGAHELAIVVESPWGTKQRATLPLSIAYREYVEPDNGKVEKPDARLPGDPAPKDLPFGISDVWVEKPQVCVGEPTRIRMTAFDQRGLDKWLVPVVAGEQSWEATFTAWPSAPGMRMVPVTLFDANAVKGGNVDAIHTFVYVEVKNCFAPFPMYVEKRAIPPSEDLWAFRVTMYNGPAWVERLADRDAPSAAATPASFKWTFGDGTSTTTREPIATHQFPPELERPDERQTLYKVRVDAIDGSGATMATTYAVVEVANRTRQLKHEQGLLQLVAVQPPGGGAADPDGTRHVAVELLNLDGGETARIDRMKIRLVGCDGKDAGERGASPSSVFKELAIGPRQRIAGTFSLPKDGLEHVCYANAEVAGESEPGKLPVVGFFQLVTGETPGVALSDDQEEVLQQARALLGNPKIVSVDDVRRLEQEGKIPRYVLTKDPFANPN